MGQPLIAEVFIHCDPTTAFDLLADVRNETRSNKRVSAAELRSEGPVRGGSRFQTVYLGQENDVALAELDRPERVLVAATNTMMDIDTTHVLTRANGGTRVVVTTDVRRKGLATAPAHTPPKITKSIAMMTSQATAIAATVRRARPKRLPAP